MVEVLKPGFFTTIQDQGRFGYGQYGVPVSGFMDSYSARFANTVLNNDQNDALLEMTMTGCSLKFHISTQIALAGAQIQAYLDGQKIDIYKPISIKKNSIFECDPMQKGFRTYLAVKHGFKMETHLGSRSFYHPVTQRQLKKGDVLNVQSFEAKLEDTRALLKFNTSVLESNTLEVFPGPEYDLLNDTSKSQIHGQTFTIGTLNNRMGYQLCESLGSHTKTLLTGPVLPGTIQWTPSGQLIILMRDCQTTGGYPRILQLPEEAINILSQKRAKDIISFNLKE